jgi:hypothetical protein
VSRRILLTALLGLATLAVAVVGTATDVSQASFTTSSQSTVTARAESISAWIRLWSQSTDPSGLTGYATRRVQSGVAPLCATGADEALTCTMGGIRTNTTYTFNRTFTLEGVIPFPDPSITTVTIQYTLIADGSTGLQPISGVTFTSVNGSTRKFGVNVTLRTTGSGWVTNRTYTPKIRLTMTYTGSPASYFVYEVPVSVTIVTW